MSEQEPNLSVGRNLKIALFHLGSGMADVLTTGVWNRIMISDLGVAATPIGLLVSLRYFLAPFGIWAGRLSDERTFLGFRRLFWIWLGRAMMILSTLMLGVSTAQLARYGTADMGGAWLVIGAALLLFSIGSTISGTTFLALIYDRSAEHQRGRAVGIVWTFLLLGFTVGGVLFGLLLPEHAAGTTELSFAPDALQNLFLIAAMAFGVLWFFPLLGEEKHGAGIPAREAAEAAAQPQRSIRQDLAQVWTLKPMRYFLFYLCLSMAFAFSQDLILEPFAGDVFNMGANVTNRFSAYWGTFSILFSFLALWAMRKQAKRVNNTNLSIWGVWILIGAFALFALGSFANIRQLVTPGLIVLGIGLGLWNIGTLGLMMDLSPTGRAGTFLGFWTMSVTLARGVGVSAGGILRDLGLWATNNAALAYGLTFTLGALGLGVALYCLYRVNVAQYKAEQTTPVGASILAGAMD